MEELNILLTSAGRREYLARWFREALAKEDLRGSVFAANSTWLSPAMAAADGTFLTPPIADPAYIPALASFCRAHRIRLVIPLIDEDVLALSDENSRRTLALAGARVLCAPAWVCGICDDKLAMFRYLRGHDMAVPATYTLADLHRIRRRRGRDRLPFPLVGKERCGHGSRGMFRADDPLQLAAGLERAEGGSYSDPVTAEDSSHSGTVTAEGGSYSGTVIAKGGSHSDPVIAQRDGRFGTMSHPAFVHSCDGREASSLIFQPLLSGREYNLDVISDLNGRYVATIVKEKLAMRSGETDAAVIVSPYSENGRILTALGRRLAELLPHPGSLDCDVILPNAGTEDREGTGAETGVKNMAEPYILDLNARFGGGYPFAHLAGADLPRSIVRWLSGRSVEPGMLEAEPGVCSMKSPRAVELHPPVGKERIGCLNPERLAGQEHREVPGEHPEQRECPGRGKHSSRERWHIVRLQDRSSITEAITSLGHLLTPPLGSNARRASNTWLGSNTRRASNTWLGSNTRRESNTSFGSNTRREGNTWLGSNTWRASNTWLGSNARRESSAWFGSNTWLGSNAQREGDTCFGSSARQGEPVFRPNAPGKAAPADGPGVPSASTPPDPTRYETAEEFCDKLCRSGIVLAALLSNGECAGALGMYANAVDPQYAWMTFLAVQPAHQGKGIGTVLFAAALDRALAAGRTTLRLTVHSDNLQALVFYRQQGCHVVRPLADGLLLLLECQCSVTTARWTAHQEQAEAQRCGQHVKNMQQ